MSEQLKCNECGESMVIEDDGVSHHITPDGAIDYDADGDHVAYTTDDIDVEEDEDEEDV